MPAKLDDPTAPPIYRTSGEPPFPYAYGPLPAGIVPKIVVLRDRITTATLVPLSSPAQAPTKLTAYLCELLNREIEKGDTYPMVEPLPLSAFGPYWFSNFAAVMVLGSLNDPSELISMEEEGAEWTKMCLGSFYVKPNYPGRSSHVCNGGFLVTDAARNRGVGRLMGEGYLNWAPKLGYTYSVFNLVYETNVASLRIWDALGFKRIGRVKGCGNLKSYPDEMIDAIIFGRELGGEGEEYVSEERFDKIRFYLKTATYPSGSDRAEKSRLRSAATHYRLVPGESGNGEDDKLMLKGKEVISDPHKQYEIARQMHNESHGGINKTTATIAEQYHWVRIKETVSLAIRNCNQCQESNGSKESAYGRNKRPAPPSPERNGSTSKRQALDMDMESPNAQLHAEAGALHHQQRQTDGPDFQDPRPYHLRTSQAPMQGQYAQQTHHHIDQSGTDYSNIPLDPRIMHWGAARDQHHNANPSDGPVHALPNGTAPHRPDVDHDDEEMRRRLRETLDAQIMQDEEDHFRRQFRDAAAGGR